MSYECCECGDEAFESHPCYYRKCEHMRCKRCKDGKWCHCCRMEEQRENKRRGFEMKRDRVRHAIRGYFLHADEEMIEMLINEIYEVLL